MLNENNEFEQTPEDIAKICGFYEDFCTVRIGEMIPKSSGECTMIITDDVCKLHAALPVSRQTPELLYSQQRSQPENPKRLEVMMDKPYGALLGSEFGGIVWVKNVQEAYISDVLRVHEYSYVSSIESAVKRCGEDGVLRRFDIDTIISKESYKAALVAANCVVKAVDELMQGRCKNAFCIVRPPGHHVGPLGAVGSEEDPGSKSTGFCLFNNIGVGAAYAKYAYRSVLKKVVIIDFDVHHGNGTEAMVRNLVPSMITHEVNSVPFSGILQYQSYKPWLEAADSNNVLFVSSHAYGSDSLGKFYPASGKLCTGKDLHPAGVLNLPMGKPTDSSAFRLSK